MPQQQMQQPARPAMSQPARPPAQPGPRHDPQSTIVVPGIGRISVEPDVASVRLGVSIVRQTAGAARQGAAQTMNAILDAVRAVGVARRDVRTALVSLSPVTDYSAEGGPRVTGYQTANSVAIVVRDLDKVGALIDAALAAGASTLDALEFHLDDPAAAEQQARAAAMVDARARATTIAAAAGVTLGPISAVVEGGPATGPIPFAGGARLLAMEAKAETPVEAGTQEITVSLTVTFAIR
jgi:hypothetical protein